MLETINDLKSDAVYNNVDLYEKLVEAWEFIVNENESQLDLVSQVDRDSWVTMRTNFENKLIEVGEKFESTGEWDENILFSLRKIIGSHSRKTEEELRNNDQAKTKTLLQRLKNLRSK